ncbi:MAG: methylmalonyl Co-A mutase-associated GTPase MeaB [Bacteroidales bacterium]
MTKIHQGDFFEEYKNDNSALIVNKGIAKPPIVNPYFKKKMKPKKFTIDDYMEGILKGNTSILSQAITLVESILPEHRIMAHELILRCNARKDKIKSRRIGITGVPGVGKSTFIESFGGIITERGHKLAVLAIDPSSEKSKGSILGDKTRMETLCNNKNAFIRPSPSEGSLGGVARKTRETILLCETAGYDTIFIETVGVGQSETTVHSMSDFFLLLMLAGAGDGLQGIKRGIIEMSDLISINKADGNNTNKAKLAMSLYNNALHLYPPTESKWIPTTVTCSAVTKTGLIEILDKIDDYFTLVQNNGYYEKRRREQAQYWMFESINDSLKSMFYENDEIKPLLEKLENEVLLGKKDSFVAAGELLEKYKNII